MSKVSMHALLPRGKRKFAQVMADNVLSEYSTHTETCSSSDAEFYEPPNPSKIKDFNFIEETLESKDPVTMSLLEMYDKRDKLRDTRWKLTHPEQVDSANIKQLKRLLVSAFIKKKVEIDENIEQTQLAVTFSGFQ